MTGTRTVTDRFTIGTEHAFGGLDDVRERAELAAATTALNGHTLEVLADKYEAQAPRPDAEGELRRWAIVQAHHAHQGLTTPQQLRADQIRLRLTAPTGEVVLNTLPESKGDQPT